MKAEDLIGQLDPDDLKKLIRHLDEKLPEGDSSEPTSFAKEMMSRLNKDAADEPSADASEEASSDGDERPTQEPAAPTASSAESLDPRKIRPDEEERMAELY